MPINVTNLQTFSDTDMVTLFRWAIAQLAISQEVEVQGRRITRAQLPALIAALEVFELRTANGPPGGNVALVEFDDPPVTKFVDPSTQG